MMMIHLITMNHSLNWKFIFKFLLFSNYPCTKEGNNRIACQHYILNTMRGGTCLLNLQHVYLISNVALIVTVNFIVANT